ncbi:MAG: C45 family peptidase [Candidatus Thermoplasmatota archaeon]|uniref:Peptidase C45 hydrolase domain-containing protein n=1 Tax=Candidatus Sysuiplasma superficiale TaxID=2823368 RepID=A0A8J8CBF3_9ARCH|nr:hypothetical protein [Candidatus Sysuiplasma superficiale]MCL4347161.1 C45 family peptidase [Candidatus Thermoplasmatota archaeon]
MAEVGPAPEFAEYYKLINAGGNHYDIGRKMTDAFTPALHSRLSSPPDGVILENAMKSAELTFELHPVLKDELQGISEGISIDFEAILCEISDTFSPATPAATIIAKKESSLLIGRNFSTTPGTIVRNMLRLDPNDAYASLGRMGGYFGGTFESIGVYGIYASAEITERNQVAVTGTASYMIPRIITESSKDLQSALSKLRTLKPMHRSLFIVADSSAVYTARWNGSSFDVQEIVSFPVLIVKGKVNAVASKMELEDIRKMLSDHDSGFCLHDPGSETIYSLVTDMASEKVEYTAGSPCKSPYTSVDWPGGYG